MLTLGFLVFLFGCLSIRFNRDHILVLLLSFELIVLGVFVILVTLINSSLLEILIVYLVFAVCEASLGLGVLVLRIYFYGRDFLGGYSVLSC